LTRSRDIAIRAGLRYVYTGNVHDFTGSSTYCHSCGEILIGRDWYELSTWNIERSGARATCKVCGTEVAGVFEDRPGNWGSRRQGLRNSIVNRSVLPLTDRLPTSYSSSSSARK